MIPSGYERQQGGARTQTNSGKRVHGKPCREFESRRIRFQVVALSVANGAGGSVLQAVLTAKAGKQAFASQGSGVIARRARQRLGKEEAWQTTWTSRK